MKRGPQYIFMKTLNTTSNICSFYCETLDLQCLPDLLYIHTLSHTLQGEVLLWCLCVFHCLVYCFLWDLFWGRKLRHKGTYKVFVLCFDWLIDWLIDWLYFVLGPAQNYLFDWYKVVTKCRSDSLLMIVLWFWCSVINLQNCSGIVSYPNLLWFRATVLHKLLGSLDREGSSLGHTWCDMGPIKECFPHDDLWSGQSLGHQTKVKQN